MYQLLDATVLIMFTCIHSYLNQCWLLMPILLPVLPHLHLHPLHLVSTQLVSFRQHLTFTTLLSLVNGRRGMAECDGLVWHRSLWCNCLKLILAPFSWWPVIKLQLLLLCIQYCGFQSILILVLVSMYKLYKSIYSSDRPAVHPSVCKSAQMFIVCMIHLKCLLVFVLLLKPFVSRSVCLSVSQLASLYEYIVHCNKTQLLCVAFMSAEVSMLCGSCLKQHLLFYNLLTMAINPFVVSVIYHIP